MPRVKSPLHAAIIAHGIITVAEPKIGRASTKPIPKAASRGYSTFNPANLKIYSPIRQTKNETPTKINSAFNRRPNDLLISRMCFPIFFTHNGGK